MNRLARRAVKRLTSGNRLFALFLFCLFAWFFLSSRNPRNAGSARLSASQPLEPLDDPIPCIGPRGLRLDQSPDDELRYEHLDSPYPSPFAGSHAELGLNQTWMSADGRYGPYGYGEDRSGYGRSRVDWYSIDWGALMDACLARNTHRFPHAPRSGTPRLGLPTDGPPRLETVSFTRRTALVVRFHEDQDFKVDDLWFVRSLIVEASLRSGGEYTVLLLVQVKDTDGQIYRSDEAYTRKLDTLRLPPELRSIAVLWNDSLLRSWYPSSSEHTTAFRLHQPLLLLALHAPFDHYWHFDLNVRFTGDAGAYLPALSAFARAEPRKQALERATFAYTQGISSTYAEFTRAVDVANGGQSRAWPAIAIPDVPAIGPEPPVTDPAVEDFSWGVGEDADFIATGLCTDVRDAVWAYKDDVVGFAHGVDTPRYWCPPSISRASRTLLLAIHREQHTRGLRIPSEAMLPSWALWLGLKISFPPQPGYMRHGELSPDDRARKGFGVAPRESADGMGGTRPWEFADRGYSWWWLSSYPRRIMNVWLFNVADVTADDAGEAMPNMLRVKNGVVYAPNMALYPVKM